MYMIPFNLYEFEYINEDNAKKIIYIIATSWEKAFNNFYNFFENGNYIIAVKLVANENIDMIIDENYVKLKTPNTYDNNDYHVIKGINKYPTENF